MLKFAGILTVIAVCSLLGFYFSQRLKSRQKRLEEICLFIGELENCISSGAELKSFIEERGKRAGVSQNGLKTEISSDGLEKGDISLLEDFFSALGMGDAPSQLKRCDAYLALFAASASCF